MSASSSASSGDSLPGSNSSGSLSSNLSAASSEYTAAKQDPNYFAAVDVWSKYRQVRPVYPSSLFDLIFEYHRRKSSARFVLAADFGSGPGTIVPELLRAFKRVEASDLNPWQVHVGRSHLQQIYGPQRVDFHVGAAGHSHWLKDDSVDLFIAAESAQWFDLPKWTSEASRKLRSGGTIAIIYYGCNATIIDPPEAASSCNKLFSILFETTWKQEGFPQNALLAHATRLDSVGLPEEHFDKKQEERHKWNLPEAVSGPYGLGENPPTSRAIFKSFVNHSTGSHSFEYTPHGDLSDCYLQRREWTTKDLLAYLESLGMPLQNLYGCPEYQKTMDELHAVVGGPSGTFTAGWWLSLVLATRL